MTPALGALSPETRHLNLDFSVADTDMVLSMARRHSTLADIANAFARQKRVVSHEQIDRICADAGVYVRRYRRPA